MFAIHPAIFPLNAERAGVADIVEGDDDVLEVDVAVAERTEVPVPARVAEGNMAAEYADRAVAVAPPHVFHVDVENPLAEQPDELHVVNVLIAEVRGVEVEAEAFVFLDGSDGALGAGDVERNFGRVNFEGEVYVERIERLEDWPEPLREIVEAFLPVLVAGRRERVDRMPDGGAGKAVDDGGGAFLAAEAGGLRVHERACGLAGLDHLFGGAFADAFRFAVAPDIGRQDALVPGINVVADRLADEVAGNRERGEAIAGEDVPAFLAVAFVGNGLVHIEMVAPTGEFEAVEAKALGFLAHRFEG